MYTITIKNLSDSSETVIYESNDTSKYIEKPSLSLEWQQPGSLSFTIIPGHPSYNDVKPIITFVYVYRDNEELFFGRVLTVDKELFGKKDVYCEGALNFLTDGQLLHSCDQTMTVTNFMIWCMNEMIGSGSDPDTIEARKQFIIGDIDSSLASQSAHFKTEEYAEPKSTLDEQLINRFGGCFVIRKETRSGVYSPSGHSISYLKTVGNVTSEKIRICENVRDRTDHDSGESIFTILRPIGANTGGDNDEPCKLSTNGGVIELPDMIAKYGRICKTENFSDQDTEAGLRAAAQAYIARLGMANDDLPKTCDIKFVDFHYLNPQITMIGFGDVFTDIEGYENQTMVVGHLELDLENPANDSLSLYNQTYLDAREYSALLESSTTAASNKNSSTRSSGGGSSIARTLANTIDSTKKEQQAETEKEFKRYETKFEKTDEKFSWLATESEWDELSQSGHVTAYMQLDRTARYVLDTAKKELPFAEWKEQWLIAHPEDASLSDTELRDKYNAWIETNPYAIYNNEYSDATRTERIISKTGVNELGENETITSRVTETADRLQSEITSSVSGVYTVLERTLSNFRNVISDDVSGYKSEIEQSNNSFKAEIHNTISDIYTRILSWDGGAAIDIRQGNRVFKQFNAPSYTLPDDDTLQAGDIWVKSNDMRTWGETSDKPWGDVNSFHWDDYVGDEIYVWKDGRWQRVLSEKELVVQAHRFQTTLDETWDVIDDTANGLRVEMSRTVSRFYQTFTDSVNGLSSTIEQTASQIRSEVSDTKNGLQSSITQTASQIRSEVSDTRNNLQSSITQTASQIRSEVSDTKNNLQSSITQTASQIRSEVSNTANSLRSSITQQENRIDLVVEGTGSNAKIKPAAIIAAINEQTGQSQVLIEANQIAVAATDLASWGVYTDGTLTGGVIAEKLNSGTNTYVSGDRVFIGDISFDYQRVYPSSSTNPAAMDYFEKISNNYYRLTKDITPVSGKAYYQRIIGVNAENVSDKFTAVDRLIAGKVDTNVLTANYITTTNLEATYAKLTDLTADKLTVTGTTKLGDVLSVNDGSAIFSEPVVFSGNSGNVSINNTKISAKTYQINTGGVLKFIGTGSGEYYDVTANTVKDFVTGVQVVADGNNYKLQKTTVYNSNWTDVGNFSRATTLSGAWSGSKYTVTASPQGNTKSIGFTQDSEVQLSLATNGTPSGFPSGNRKVVSAPLRIYQTQGTTTTDRYTTSLTINAEPAWNHGWEDAASLTVAPSAGTGETFTFQAPTYYEKTQGNWVREQVNYNFTITKGATPSYSGYAAVSCGGTTVGRINIGDWYTAGINDVGVYIVPETQTDTWYSTWDLPAGDSITFYPAKWVINEFVLDEDHALTVTASGGGGSHNITCTSAVSSIGSDRGNRLYAGAISKAGVSAYTYLGFAISCGGTTQYFYITVNP